MYNTQSQFRKRENFSFDSIMLILLLLNLWTSIVTSATISTPSGFLAGFEARSRSGRTFTAYKSIPYAKPPVGELRFQDPVPFGKWQGVYRAVQDPPKCLQQTDVMGTGSIPTEVIGSEDCLYLNVYRPNIENDTLPVIVYIHGGSFVAGYSGATDLANYIMDENVILVTVHYRLGTLGYMSLENTVLSGNYASKDQALAIIWVKNNIESFGGNPRAITLLGDSAGGTSVHLLAVSPWTKDIVSSVIMVSGTANLAQKSLNRQGLVRTATMNAAKFLGCWSYYPRVVLNCLQKADPNKLVPLTILCADGSWSSFLPVVERHGNESFMPYNPLEVDTNQTWVITYSTGERLLKEISFLSNPSLLTDTMNNLDEYLEEEMESTGYSSKLSGKVKARYFTSVTNRDDLTQLSLIFEDSLFSYPAQDLAVKHSGPTWLSHFEYRGEFTGLAVSDTSVDHCDDLIYLFDTLTEKGKSLNAKDLELSKKIVKMLVNVATYGNPAPEGASDIVWNEWKSNEMLRVTNDGIKMADPTFYRENEDIYGFWKSMACLTKK